MEKICEFLDFWQIFFYKICTSDNEKWHCGGKILWKLTISNASKSPIVSHVYLQAPSAIRTLHRTKVTYHFFLLFWLKWCSSDVADNHQPFTHGKTLTHSTHR